MSVKISVIMPVYNTQAYLKRAVDSVLNQTYRDWELIMIDDGSSDQSPQLCDQFAKNVDRITVIHKENGGQGSARNIAIDNCSGEYVMFLDSDDWIDVDTMQFLVDAQEEYDADVVECGCRSVSAAGVVDVYIKKPTIIMNACECIDHLLESDDAVGPGACSKIFKIDTIKNKRFPPIRAYEDYQFIYDVCADVKKYVHIYEPKWNYYHRENSTMTSAFSIRKVSLLDAQEGICSILKEKGSVLQFQRSQKSLCSKQFYILNCLLNNLHLNGAVDEVKKIRNNLLISYSDYMRNPVMGLNKVMLLLVKYTPFVFWRLILKAKFR